MSRLATDEEVAGWQTEGWVLLDGLIDAAEVDAVAADVGLMFPTPDEYHRDPEGETRRRLGAVPTGSSDEDALWGDGGPGFRTAQRRWSREFPFGGSGVLDRLCVHPSLVDFAARALGGPDLRLYQAHASAKYAGVVDYEQPMHVDQNHSWLPPGDRAPWWNLQGFLYLTDVTEDDNPTHLAPATATPGLATRRPVLMPDVAPEVYAAERPALGPRGSYLAYRSDVFHRGSPFGSPAGGRIVLALAFKRAAADWIGYSSAQSRANDGEWTRFASGCTPRELELFGFPPPGHPVWDEALLAETAHRYPFLDLTPWRQALAAH